MEKIKSFRMRLAEIKMMEDLKEKHPNFYTDKEIITYCLYKTWKEEVEECSQK